MFLLFFIIRIETCCTHVRSGVGAVVYTIRQYVVGWILIINSCDDNKRETYFFNFVFSALRSRAVVSHEAIGVIWRIETRFLCVCDSLKEEKEEEEKVSSSSQVILIGI